MGQIVAQRIILVSGKTIRVFIKTMRWEESPNTMLARAYRVVSR